MARSIASRIAFKALSWGVRLPRPQRLEDVYQQGRTIDEIRKRRIDVLLDVGANRGFYASHVRALGYKGKILSFEPDPDAFARLELAASRDPDWHVFHKALGAAQSIMDFNVIVSDGETVLSSAYTHIGNLPTTVITVEVDTLANIIADHCSHGSRIFLKMDTQGYDLEVFAGIRDTSPIHLLQSEVSVIPLYKEMPSFTKALAHYQQAGFTLLDLFVVNRTAEGTILEYDALMMPA